LQNFHARQYSVRDFEEWENRGDLVLAPKFQRRSVWEPKAKSFLIDTIIRGKPVPQIYVRQLLNLKTRQEVREVVDGQQRLRTVLSFIKDGFTIHKQHNEELAGLSFSDLEPDSQGAILHFEFNVIQLFDVSDAEIYDIFARLNTYAMTLNAQELRHAKFFGDFRSSVYALSKQTVTFWEENKIITSKNILRMHEAEYISDLLIAMSSGIRAKDKRTLDVFYKNNDDNFSDRKLLENRFLKVLDTIGGIMGDTLADSTLNSTRLFYPFFCAVYHMQFGLPDFDAPRAKIMSGAFVRVRNSLEHIDEIIGKAQAAGKAGEDSLPLAEEKKFFNAFSQYWVHADKRVILTKYISKLIMKSLNE